MASRRTILIKNRAQLRGFRQGLNYAYIDGSVKKTQKGYKVQVVKK